MSLAGSEPSVGPGWFDVNEFTLTLERTHHCAIDHILRPHINRHGQKELIIITVCYNPGIGGDRTVRVQQSSVWDRKTFKTVPALLYNHLYMVDHRMTENVTKAEQACLF